MERRSSAVWLIACTAAWSLLVVPGIVEAFFAGRVFVGGPSGVLQWITIVLWAAFPLTLVAAVVVMWKVRRAHPMVSVGFSVAPLVQLAVVTVLVVVLR